jgi:mannosyltransferase OCH1-like enzyme
MIPQKIHYIWLSKEKIPEGVKNMMASWKKHLPEYEIKRWDSSSFDIESVPFVKKAVRSRKWAFASDYIRLYALYNEGGLYLDSDILIKKPLSGLFQDYDFLSAVEYHPLIAARTNMRDYLTDDFHSRDTAVSVPGIGLQAAFMASVPRHPFVKACMSWYENNDFVRDLAYTDKLIAPGIYAKKAEQFGFVYRNTTQTLKDNMRVVSSDYIASHPETDGESSYAVHYCAGSWQKKTLLDRILKKTRSFFNRVVQKLQFLNNFR